MINDRGSNGRSFAYLSPHGELKAISHKYNDGLSSLGAETSCSYNNLYNNQRIYKNSKRSLLFPATLYNSKLWSKSSTRLTYDNYLLIKGTANPILCGPYISLLPGKYQAEFILKSEKLLFLNWTIRFTSDYGQAIATECCRIQKKLLPGVDIGIDCTFELSASVENFEIVVDQADQTEFYFLSLTIQPYVP